MESARENFRDALDSSVMKSDGSEVPSLPSIIFLREEDKEGSVDTFKVSKLSIEGIKQGDDVGKGDGPSGL